jgi:hypothetical protein
MRKTEGTAPVLRSSAPHDLGEDVVEPRICDRVAKSLRVSSSNRQSNRGHLPHPPKVLLANR